MTGTQTLDPDAELALLAQERRIAAAVENLTGAARAHASRESASSMLSLLRAAATLWASGWREVELER
jgi:hypothetical protein